MSTPDIKIAVSEYLDLVVNGRGSESENLDALEFQLDRLAWLQHHNQVELEQKRQSAPLKDFDKMRALADGQFPSLGPYVAPALPARKEAPVEVRPRHAIDDVAEIACYAYDVARRFQETGAADALWHFSAQYREHWSRPLRALQWYLNACKLEGMDWRT